MWVVYFRCNNRTEWLRVRDDAKLLRLELGL